MAERESHLLVRRTTKLASWLLLSVVHFNILLFLKISSKRCSKLVLVVLLTMILKLIKFCKGCILITLVRREIFIPSCFTRVVLLFKNSINLPSILVLLFIFFFLFLLFLHLIKMLDTLFSKFTPR